MAVLTWRQIAQTFLRAMAEAELPVTHAVEFLREQGISYRYQEMLRTYRAYSHVVEVRPQYQYTPKKYRIPEGLFGKPLEYQTRDYLYEGGFSLRDRETGEEFTKPARLSSDFHLTQNQIEDLAEGMSEEGFKTYNWEIVGFEVTAAFKRKV